MKKSGWQLGSGRYFLVLALLVMPFSAAFARNVSIYTSTGELGDIRSIYFSSPKILNIDTDLGQMSNAFQCTGDTSSGVCVFDFKTVDLGSDVTVVVTGSLPLTIAASEDMYIGCPINVSPDPSDPQHLGRAGGGSAGTGGTGGAGGAGGPGGQGGQGGGGVKTGGDGGVGTGSGGSTGGVGSSAAGGVGAIGGIGSAGQSGGAGQAGAYDNYNSTLKGRPGTSGPGSTAAGGGGNGQTGGTGGGGGTGGSGGQGHGTTSFTNVTGDNGGNGGTGSTGNAPAYAGNANGGSGTAPTSVGASAYYLTNGLAAVSNLTLVGGFGGGGGGGGSGGGGGCGGGGGGGGGSGGGGGGGGGAANNYYVGSNYGAGGGGGGAGAGGGAGGGGGGGQGGCGGGGGSGVGVGGAGQAGQVAPNDAPAPGQLNGAAVGQNNAAVGGNGSGNSPGGGGSAGTGGAGGSGGSGGNGGSGGDGGQGGGGGGVIVLTSLGLLQLTSAQAQLDISAAAPAAGGAGAAGGPGAVGAAGAGGGSGQGGGGGGTNQWTISGLGVVSSTGGSGGSGGSGGTGGPGGTGHTGGTGGAGSPGGFGTPGMVKLHGSVIMGSSGKVLARNVGGSSDPYQGMVTLIDNMSQQARAVNTPTMEQHSEGTNTALPRLGTYQYYQDASRPPNPLYADSFYLAGLQVPLIPTLEGGPKTYGYCMQMADPFDDSYDYFNKAAVDNAINNMYEPSSAELVMLPAYDSLQPWNPLSYSYFNGHHQIFVVNPTGTSRFPNAEVATDIWLNVGAKGAGGTVIRNNPPKLVGGTGVLQPAEVWTTVVNATQTDTNDISLQQMVTIVGNPVGADVYVGGSVEFDTDTENGVTYSAWPVSYTWYRSHQGVWQMVYSNVPATDGTITEYYLDPAKFSVTKYPYGVGERSNLAITGITPDDEGAYRCEVVDYARQGNPICTTNAYLKVGGPVTVTTNPVGANKYVGDDYTFTVAATGGNTPLHYQWKFAGNPIGFDVPELSVPYLLTQDTGSYSCVISDNISAQASSSGAALQVNNPMSLSQQPAPASLVEYVSGPAVTYTVAAADGYPPYAYKWYHDAGSGAALIAGATNASYSMASPLASNSGTYYCVVTDNLTGTVTSDTVSLTLASHLQVTGLTITIGDSQQAASPVLLPVGESFSLTVTATGGYGNKHYQWKKNAVNISGSPDSGTFLLSAVALADGGTYSCEVSDSLSDVVDSSNAVLNVTTPAPVAGVMGWAILSGLLAAGGSMLVRRKK